MTHLKYAVLSAAVVAVATALAAWYTHRHRAARYHRRRWQRPNCHAAATRMHRVHLFARWVLSLRIHITSGRTA